MKRTLFYLTFALYSTASGMASAAENDNTRTFTADKRYLLFPCARGFGGQDKVFIHVNGKPYMSHYEALIASANPDHWRHIDLKLMQGKTLSVKIEGPNAAGIGLVRTSDTIPGKVPAYQEPERSKVQFSPLRGWMNDTAGLIFYQGTWNLYFGHTRFNNQVAMANNAWGHATSNISQPAEIIAEFDPGSATQIAFTGAELGIS